MPYRYRNKETGAVQALRTKHRGLARASNWELLSDEDKTSEDTTAAEDTSAEDTEDSAPRRSRRSRSSSAQTEQSGDAQA